MKSPADFFPFPGRAAHVALLGGLTLFVAVEAVAASSWRFRSVTARSLTTGFVAEPVAGDRLRPTERAFLSKAAQASREHVRLAEWGASRTENSDLRSLSRQLLTDYRRLGETVDALNRRKGGVAIEAPRTELPPPIAEKPGMSTDAEFLRTVAQASESILVVFEQAASDAKDPDVRELAASQLPVLRAHRTTITELKRALD